jgi:hypothetical protein
MKRTFLTAFLCRLNDLIDFTMKSCLLGGVVVPETNNVDPSSSFSSSTQITRPKPDHIVIHHLSDLDFDHLKVQSLDPDAEDYNLLNAYNSYVSSIDDKEEFPQLVVFSGDLTASGELTDFEYIAQTLSLIFNRWSRELNQHIFLVPGLNDLSWNNGRPSFAQFQKAFQGFGLPRLTPLPPQNPRQEKKGRWGWRHREPLPDITGSQWPETKPGPQDSAFYKEKPEYAVYLVDTCASLEILLNKDLLPGITQQFQDLPEQFRQQLESYLSHLNGVEGTTDHRKKFLKLLEESLISLDTGAIRKDDIKAFREALVAWQKARAALSTTGSTSAPPTVPADTNLPPSPTDPGATIASPQTHLSVDATAPQTISEPLKIVVSHHPLIIHQENLLFGEGRNDLGDYGDFVDIAQEYGFQLGLHGHLHKPQLLTDLDLQSASDSGTQISLRQLGAASMGQAKAFNKITATREFGATTWQIKVETISLKSQKAQKAQDSEEEKGTSVFSIQILDPQDDRSNAQSVRSDRESLSTRRSFDAGLSTIITRYFDRLVDKEQQDLPIVAFKEVERVVKRIFRGVKVEVGLVLKHVETVPRFIETARTPDITSDLIYDLRYRYIYEDRGKVRLDYPASVAAWSLILGRELIYDASAITTGVNLLVIKQEFNDHRWLEDSQKMLFVGKLLSARLKRIESEMATTERVNLKARLENMQHALDTKYLTMNDIFQPIPGQTSFISVPIPLRPANFLLPTGPKELLPEIGVLNVTLLPLSEEDSEAPQLPANQIFTHERIDMLKTLSDLMCLILTNAEQVGRPKPSWLYHR